MSRSSWKTAFLNYNIIKSGENIKTSKERSSTVYPTLIGKQLEVHNGRKYLRIKITQEMIGHKLGEFLNTRAKYIFNRKK